ncbi:MAG: hypothetical protein R3343_11335 [Nitriliruptorales bacterium]|nr:hypothetical protein [Nitriliruptorales bacterium]
MREPTARERERALAFTSCEQCTYDFATGEGERSCSYGACPYLPELLDPRCPICHYDFYTREGNSECGAAPRCEFARKEAPIRVEIVSEWRRRHGLPDLVA